MKHENTYKGNENMNTENSVLVKVTEAARILGVSAHTITKLISQNKLTGMGFGAGKRTNFVTRASIDALVKGGTNEC